MVDKEEGAEAGNLQDSDVSCIYVSYIIYRIKHNNAFA